MNPFVEILTKALVLPNKKNYIEVKKLQIQLPKGDSLIDDISFSLHSGNRLLIRGISGKGKTTILRAINGLWPYTKGEIYIRPTLTSLFVPQKLYIPKANLKEAICYPKLKRLPDDNEIIQILTKCGLSYLSNKLYETCDWNGTLSLGEQQKIAFCRIIINKPDIIYLDEITSALDEESERYLYNEIIKILPNSVIISVGHRSTLIALHHDIISVR